MSGEWQFLEEKGFSFDVLSIFCKNKTPYQVFWILKYIVEIQSQGHFLFIILIISKEMKTFKYAYINFIAKNDQKSIFQK